MIVRGKLAKSLLARAKGLLFHPPLAEGEGLLLAPENSIHTFFMGFAIDVAYLDGADRVIHLIPEMKPFRISLPVKKARAVLEMPAGTLLRTETQVGDQLEIIDGG
ncbi:MAG: DUF192 domain-containing protein [Chloroflexota bacterium]